MSISESEWYQPVVVSGPSGVGKSTILKFLFDDFPDCFAFSVSRERLYFLSDKAIPNVTVAFMVRRHNAEAARRREARRALLLRA